MEMQFQKCSNKTDVPNYKEKDNRNKATCVFCGHKNSVKNECGKLHLTKTGHLAAHHKCMQYSAGLGQYKSHHFGGFKVRQVEKEQNRGKKIYCCLKKCLASSKTGATAGCAWAYCRKSYHFLCAHRKGLTSRRLKKTPKKQAVMYLVFCKPEHKKKYLEMEEKKGYKNETQSESDGEQDSTSNDDDDDDDDDDDSSTDGSSTSDQKLFCKSSAMCPRKLSRKHRVTHKSPSKRKKSPLEDEDALSESAQRSQGKKDGKETSPGPLTSLSNNNLKIIEFDCMRKFCENNSDLQPSATDVLLEHSKKQQDIKDNVEDLVSQSSGSRTQCQVQKRKSSPQTEDKKRTKMKKINSEHSSKIETSSSLNMQSLEKRCVNLSPQKTEKGGQRKLPLVENGHEKDGDKSDISVMTDEDSNDSTSNSSPQKLQKTKETTENGNCRIGCVTLLGSGLDSVAGALTVQSLQSTSVNQNDVEHSNEEKEIHSSQTSAPLLPLEFLLHSDDSQSSLCSASQEITSPLCDVLVDNSCHGNQQETKNWKDNSSEDEYLLVLPADESTFKAKVDTVCQHLSNDWVIDITQMHIWSKMRPVPVEEKLMLSFIASIFEAVSCDSWNELRMLLLDAKFIQDKCDELQDNKLVQVLNMQGNADLKLSYVKAVIKRIRDLEDKILAEKKVRLVDMCSSHGVNYAVLKINKVTDPDHFIRDHLKMFCLHFLLNQNSPFVIASPEIESCDSQEELSVLEKWFTTCFQHVYKVLDFPKDEILYRLDARTDELYATFKSIVYSRETSKNDDDCLPVVIFVGKLNSDIIHFERYLEALGEKILATYSPRPVICIFPVSNFRSRLAPHIKVPVHCWSAYDPAFKPVNYIVASWKKSWLL